MPGWVAPRGNLAGQSATERRDAFPQLPGGRPTSKSPQRPDQAWAWGCSARWATIRPTPVCCGGLAARWAAVWGNPGRRD